MDFSAFNLAGDPTEDNRCIVYISNGSRDLCLHDGHLAPQEREQGTEGEYPY